MGAATDLAVTAPTLVLTLDSSQGLATLRCAGSLDTETGPELVAAVEKLLRSRPDGVTVDVGQLELADTGAARALAEVERTVRGAGATLRWRGVRSEHVRRAPVLERRSDSPSLDGHESVLLAEWLPSPTFPWSSGGLRVAKAVLSDDPR